MPDADLQTCAVGVDIDDRPVTYFYTRRITVDGQAATASGSGTVRLMFELVEDGEASCGGTNWWTYQQGPPIDEALWLRCGRIAPISPARTRPRRDPR